ncbi:MAG: hypothetical protein CFE45_19270 [Burkholderiales bacterium PBB5]|nr:MAG: hypothetical protein CFE45_19270 [Burkholderiales bacterium PBB5]
MFALLSAELAGQRNRYDLALSNYVEQANATQDAGVAERAFRIAEYLGAEQAALETAQIWAKNAPDNLDAQRATAIQLARAGQYERAMQVMETVLQAQGDTHFDFLALSAAETDPDTRNGLLHSFDRLLLKYPENGQLLFGKALLLQQDGKPETALQLLEAHNASSQEITPLLLRVRLLQGRWVAFSVVDAGPGIPAEVAQRLFAAFFTTKVEGMGLGLSLCRTVVEQHGGAIDFENLPPRAGHADGQPGGTEFRFTLPLAVLRTEQAVAR